MDYKNISYGEWLRNWINVYKKPYIKSWQTIKTQVKIHIPDNVKKIKLSELNAFDVQKALNNVEHSRTRVDIYDIYHGSLKMAYRNGFIDKDISETLIKPKHVRKIGSALSNEELNIFLTLIKGHRLEYFYRFCLTTGCRRSEALNVTWGDIYPYKCLIHIKGTKTQASNRFIPILPETALLLNEMKQGKSNDRLFPHRKDYTTKHFKKVCPTHKLHDLRHTFATRCMECGIAMNVVQRWLGHTRAETTAMIYTHVQPDFERSESCKFRLL